MRRPAQLRAPLAVAAAAGGTLTVLWWRDPESVGAFPVCMSALVFGVECPFCGGLRGMHDLLHGDVAAMMDHNALLPLYLGMIAVGFAAWVAMRLGFVSRPRPRILMASMVTLMAVSVTFGILRNLVPSLAASAG